MKIVDEQRNGSEVGQPIDPFVEGDWHVSRDRDLYTEGRWWNARVLADGAQRGSQGQEGHRHRTQRQRPSHKDGPAITQRVEHVRDERGLAHAGVPGHEQG